jgi:predicted heme/steroid binding protein
MNKQRKTSHILNVFQYDADGHVVLPASLTLGIVPGAEDNSGKVPSTAWVRSLVTTTGGSLVPTNRSITINGTSYDLSSNRSWSIDTGVLTASAGSGISLSVVSQNLNIVNTGLLTGTAGAGISVSTVNQNLNIVNTGLLSATAGSGISVSTVNQNLNIVNTGILTASAGSGVSVSVVGQNLNIVNSGILTASAGAGISLSVVSGNLNIVNTITNNNQLDNGAGYATTSYVSTQINNLVAGAPGLLDTLDELAAALGDDPSFATTITTSIATKVPQTRTITINGTSYDLSANRSWTINSMVYPSAGIALSTGTAWGSSITDNSSNWNTAYGWGNHASAGYLTSATAATTYASLTGSYANPSWITSLAYSKLTGVPAFLTSYTETDTLASVTARGASTATNSVFTGGLQARKNQSDNNYTTAALWTESYGNTTTGVAFHISGVVGKFLEMRTNGILYWENNQVVTNTGTWGISITGNAATLGGYGPNQTGGANTIVQRDANGYIQNSYFYTSGGGSERGTGISYIAGFNSSDYYIRSYTLQGLASAMSGASMNISGNSSSTSQRDFSGDISTSGMGRFTGWYNGNAATGLAAEIGISAGQAYIIAYNRQTSTYGTLNLEGSASTLRLSGSTVNVVTGALQQGGNQVLHAGNVGSYAVTSLTDTLASVTSRGSSTSSTLTSTNTLGLYVNSGGASYIGINSTSNWSYVSHLNNGTTTWDVGAFNGGQYEIRPYGGSSNRVTVQLNGQFSVNNSQNQVALFQSPNGNTWVDIVSSAGTWSMGATSGNTWAIYNRSGTNGTRFEVSTSDAWVNGNIIIHGGNIGSQSVNYASYALYLNAVNNYSWSASSGSTSFHQGISSSFVSSSEGFPSYGSVMTMRTYSGGGGTLQLYTPYSYAYGGNRLGFRFSDYVTGTWTGWRYLLNDNTDPYAANMNQYVRTSDNVSFAQVNASNIYASSDVRGSDVYTTGGWFRNHTNNNGIYWSATGWHFMPQNGSDFRIHSGSNTDAALRFETNGTTRGYVYAENDNTIGFLNNGRGWSFRTYSNGDARVYGYLYINGAGTSSSIFMADSDEGQREIHCNSNRIGFLNQSGSWGSWCDDSGNWLTGAGVYAGIFYDYDNGGYYLDPNSTSNLLHIQMPHRGNGTPNILVNNGGSENWGAIHIEGGSGNLRIGKSDAGRSWSGRVSLAMHVGASESFRVHSDGWDSLFEVWGSSGYARLKGSLEVGSDVYLGTRGTWLSSWLNQNVTTGASPSFSEVTAGYHRSYYLTGRYDVSVDHTYGIYFSSYVDYSYAIFRESGAWNHPYPDLRIAFHTGIKIGAYYGYNGTRFYNNSDMATITASVNDGDNNFRGYYDIIAYASDKRLKENIKVIDNAVDKVKQLTGMTYTWNRLGTQYGWTPSNEREAGVFAQDVQAVLPEAVKLAPFDNSMGVSKSGENFLTVKYEKIVPLLIEAIKEQQLQIEELQNKLDNVLSSR